MENESPLSHDCPIRTPEQQALEALVDELYERIDRGDRTALVAIGRLLTNIRQQETQI